MCGEKGHLASFGVSTFQSIFKYLVIGLRGFLAVLITLHKHGWDC